jgi:hypothetical protein
MPVIVKELIVKARVDEIQQSSDISDVGFSQIDEQKMEVLVALCVEKVMETLERQKER